MSHLAAAEEQTPPEKTKTYRVLAERRDVHAAAPLKPTQRHSGRALNRKRRCQVVRLPRN